MDPDTSGMFPGKLQSSTTSDRAPMATACRIGTLATSPPSYSRSDPSSTGAKMPGMAVLASSAGISRPSRSTCGRAVAMSVVIAANGSVRSAKVRSGPMKSPITVASPVLGNRCVLVCCRVRAWASSPPGKTRSRDIRAHRCDSRLAALLGSMASTAPLSEPTEVPVTMSGGTSRSPSACSIPTCTAPRLPPPPSTYPPGRGSSAMFPSIYRSSQPPAREARAARLANAANAGVGELADLPGDGGPQRRGQVVTDAGQDHQAGAVDGPRGGAGGAHPQDRVPVAVQDQHRLVQLAELGPVPGRADLPALRPGVPRTRIGVARDPLPRRRFVER